MVRVREVHDVDAALVPALHVEVATRHRDEASVMSDAVLPIAFRGGDLEVTALGHLLVVVAQLDDRVAALLHHAGSLAHRARATAPLVGPERLLPIVAEPGCVPPLVIVGIHESRQPHRLLRVRDIDYNGVGRACGAQQMERRVRGHVVAVVGARVQQCRVKRRVGAAASAAKGCKAGIHRNAELRRNPGSLGGR